MFPEISVREYREYAKVRVAALNHVLRRCPRGLIRLHVCSGCGHGPHVHDVPLEEIVGIVREVEAQRLSIEAANSRHAHEWRVWRDIQLLEAMSLMPGLVGYYTDIVEHPRLVSAHPEIARVTSQAMAGVERDRPLRSYGDFRNSETETVKL